MTNRTGAFSIVFMSALFEMVPEVYVALYSRRLASNTEHVPGAGGLCEHRPEQRRIMQYRDVIVRGCWHSPWSRWVFFFFFFSLKRGNTLCVDQQKRAGFVTSGLLPTAKGPECSWTAHRPPVPGRKGLQEQQECIVQIP